MDRPGSHEAARRSAHRFIAGLRLRLALSDDEHALLERACVASCDHAHAVLSSGAAGPDRAAADRRGALLAKLAPELSPRYRLGLRSPKASARCYGGAAAPSAQALAELARPGAQSARGVRKTASLAGRPGLDLLGEGKDPELRIADWGTAEQGWHRQTCVAFAVTACLELQRAGKGTTFTRLSPQFIYWHMRTRPWSVEPPPGWSAGATKLGHAREVLAEAGYCSLERCPYDGDRQPDGQLEGSKPAAAALKEGRRNRIARSWYRDFPDLQSRPPGVARMIYEQLGKGRPVAITIPQFAVSIDNSRTNWSLDKAWSSGIVRDPAGTDRPRGGTPSLPSLGHAVCIVGYQPGNDAIGGWFIFRNSVGRDWAHATVNDWRSTAPQVPGRGYGAISASHVERYCWEWLSLELA